MKKTIAFLFCVISSIASAQEAEPIKLLVDAIEQHDLTRVEAIVDQYIWSAQDQQIAIDTAESIIAKYIPVTSLFAWTTIAAPIAGFIKLAYGHFYDKQHFKTHARQFIFLLGAAGISAFLTYAYPFIIHGQKVQIFELLRITFRGVYDQNYKLWSPAYLMWKKSIQR